MATCRIAQWPNLSADYEHLCDVKGRRSFKLLVESLLFDNGFQAVVLHRQAAFFKRLGVPALGPAIARWNQFLTGVEISPRAQIGPGLMISHGQGIVVGAYTRIGSRALLHHQVTLGAATVGSLQDMPTIGSDCMLGAGAKVIGRVEIGDNCFIGANVLVSQDLPSGSRCVMRSNGEIVESTARPEGSKEPTT